MSRKTHKPARVRAFCNNEDRGELTDCGFLEILTRWPKSLCRREINETVKWVVARLYLWRVEEPIKEHKKKLAESEERVGKQAKSYNETQPAELPWGLLATFSDLDGNNFSLLQPPAK